MSYLQTAHDLYAEAALAPQANLCCVAAPPPALPGLAVPDEMYETNYGCGTTVHLQDLRPEQDILYVGVGGGLEALQFAYVARRPGAVVAVDRVPEMLALARRNLARAADQRLRAECLSGALPLGDYLDRIVAAGFGTIEVRSRRPYRLLDRRRYDLQTDILLEAVELVAYNVPVPDDGPCIFTGQTAVYAGEQDAFDDGKGHRLLPGIPLPVCQKTARALAALEEEIVVTPPTWHYGGGGCC